MPPIHQNTKSHQNRMQSLLCNFGALVIWWPVCYYLNIIDTKWNRVFSSQEKE